MTPLETAVRIRLSNVELEGDLTLPDVTRGLVIFAHGSGSSRLSPRNRHVASMLSAGGLGTLLFDLLTAAEEEVDARTMALRFDIGLLAQRLVEVTDWAGQERRTRELRVGYFGASTGAAAAIVAAAERPKRVTAIVSRGGRPDLAGSALERIVAPTLLIVGEADEHVIALNEGAFARISAPKAMEIVPFATHLFEEPGTLDHVARLALEWFQRYL